MHRYVSLLHHLVTVRCLYIRHERGSAADARLIFLVLSYWNSASSRSWKHLAFMMAGSSISSRLSQTSR